MSSASVQVDGVQIATPAEFLGFSGVRNDFDALTSAPSRDCSKVSTHDQQFKSSHHPLGLQAKMPCMFALIIGINRHLNPRFPSLRGAEADAWAIRDYLKTCLNTQDSNIQMVCGNDATRQNIIDALIALRDNEDIQWGDAILIYYAGRGVELRVPGWPASSYERGRIQAIVPYDFNEKGGIHVIPDSTICWLIDDISQHHGDNITLILDSCFSGFDVRGEDHNNMARMARLDHYSIPPNLDNVGELSTSSGDRSRTLSTGFHGDLPQSSHVLLAACSADGAAYEFNGRGAFTVALENVLRSTSPDQITYVGLMDRLCLSSGQNPQIKGSNRHRNVFNFKPAIALRRPYKLSYEQPDRQGPSCYILHAGAENGVRTGAEFTVYYASEACEPIGVIVPKDIKPFSTIMESISGPFPIQGNMVAVQTKAGIREKLKIYMQLTETLIPDFDSILRDLGSNSHAIVLLEDRSAADLELQREGNQIKFVILDERVTVHDLTECIHKANANVQDLRPVLQGAAHYYYHLNRSYLDLDMIKNITIEMFRMENTVVDAMTGRYLKRPYGENLLKNDIVLIDVRGFEDDLYGIKITNNGMSNLYPYIFYFDNSELSIGSCYESGGPSKFEVDSPLRANGGTLTLGYGGSRAYQYYIPNGREVDVGFLKCIFSTCPVDLSNVLQTSPFQSRYSGGSFDIPSRGGLRMEPLRPVDELGCVLIPIVQKRVG